MVQQLEQPFHPHLVHTLMRLTMSPLRREQFGHLPPGTMQHSLCCFIIIAYTLVTMELAKVARGV